MPRDPDDDLEVLRRLPDHHGAIVEARHLAGEMARLWGFDDAHDLEVLASELVTNAILHAPGGPTLRLSREGANQVRVEVGDQNPRWPTKLEPDRRTGQGLGLQVVDVLSDSWGVEDAGQEGKVVWCQVVMPTRPGGGLASGGDQV